MNRLALVLAVIVASLSGGCGAAVHHGSTLVSPRVTHVVQHERSGLLELTGPIVLATEEAMEVMTEHCGGRWHRLEGAEAVAMRSAGAAVKGGEAAWAVDDDHLIAYECTSHSHHH